jgi:hypothetical protein
MGNIFVEYFEKLAHDLNHQHFSMQMVRSHCPETIQNFFSDFSSLKSLPYT